MSSKVVTAVPDEAPNKSEAPLQRVPAEPLRRIDWLAVAPWTLLFRVPGISASWRVWLPTAVLGLVFMGRHSSPLESGPQGLAYAAAQGVASPLRLVSSVFVKMTQPPGFSFGEAYSLVFLVVFSALLTLTAARSSAAALVGTVISKQPDRPFLFAIRRVARVSVACALIYLPAIAAVVATSGIQWISLPALDPIAVVLSVIAAVGLLVATVAAPLVLVAVAIDDADVFDSASRAIAYATQRLLQFVFYVMVATALGFVAAVLLELLLTMQESLLGQAFGRAGPPFGSLADVAQQLLPAAVRGYYVAYWVAAATAIYLLLRQDIDGQPLDEMARLDDQASEPA